MSRSVPYVVITALLIGLISIFVNNPTARSGEEYVPPVGGRNNTALFIVLPHPGLSNVHLATTDALLEHYPDIKLEFASYDKLKGRVDRITGWAQRRNSAAKPIGFHTIPGQPYDDIVTSVQIKPGLDIIESIVAPPGLAGVTQLAKDFAFYISPWQAEEHLEIYHHLRGVIDKVDPAVVILDTLFSPSLDAVRESNRLHAIITPNTLIDNFPGEQPWGAMFWKYPM